MSRAVGGMKSWSLSTGPSSQGRSARCQCCRRQRRLLRRHEGRTRRHDSARELVRPRRHQLFLDGRRRAERRDHRLRLRVDRQHLGRSAAASATTSAAAFAATSPTNGAARADVHGGGAFARDFDCQQPGDPRQPLLRFPPLRAPHALRRRRRRRRPSQHQRRRNRHLRRRSALPYDGDSNWTCGRRRDGRLQLPHRPRRALRPSASRTAPATPSPAACTSMSAIASSIWATPTPATSSAPAVPTPGPRLDDITAQEIRVGLRWDIR